MEEKPGSRFCFNCFWVSLLFLAPILIPSAVPARNAEDFAEIYVDEYFEPSVSQRLSQEGKSNSEALARFAWGRIQENKDQLNEAIESYLKVLAVKPDQLKLTRKCAYLLARSGRQIEARNLLEESLDRNSNQAFSYVMLSEFLSTYHSQSQENKEKSLSLAKEAVKKFPQEPLTYEHLAKMYLLGNRREEAQELLFSTLRMEITSSDFWLRMGKIANRVWPIRGAINGSEKEFAILNQFYEKAIAGKRKRNHGQRNRGRLLLFHPPVRQGRNSLSISH